MKQIIYVDVLIVLNIIITFLLLAATSRLLRLSPSPGRYLLGSLMGGVSSLVIFAPDFGFVLSLLTKILFALIITVSVYNPKSLRVIAKETAYYFAVSFIFAGMMMFASSMPGISLVQYRNGAAYINLSFFSLIAACCLCYAVTCILGKVTKHKAAGDIRFAARIEHGGAAVTAQAMLDTGNSLTDPFTGEGVIVGDMKTLAAVVPENVRSYYSSSGNMGGIRLIPCKTVASDALLPCFRADCVKISGKNSSCTLKNAQIAVSRQQLDSLILPAMLFENSERRKDNVEIKK